MRTDCHHIGGDFEISPLSPSVWKLFMETPQRLSEVTPICARDDVML